MKRNPIIVILKKGHVMKKTPIAVIMLLTQSLLFSQTCDRIQLNQLFPNSTPLFHSIAVNDNCQAMAVWVETLSGWGGVGDPLVASFYSNGSWSTPVQIQSDISKGAQNTAEVIVDIDNSGNAAIAWYNRTDRTIYSSYYNGSMWMTEVEAATNINHNQLALVTTLKNDSSLFTVVYADSARRTNAGLTFLSYIQSANRGLPLSWTTPMNIVTDTIEDWNSSRSDNKNIVIAWVAVNRTELVATTLIDSTLSSPMNVQTLSNNLVFFTGSSHSIAINNSGNMAAGFIIVNAVSFSPIIIQASFFDNVIGSWPSPVTLRDLTLLTPSANTISTTLNNSNHALIVSNAQFLQPIFTPFLFISAENTPNTNNWQNIMSSPITISNNPVVCNNDNSNAVSFFSNPPRTINTKYRFFLGSSSSWKNVNSLFNDEFIAVTTARFSSTAPNLAIDCKHASSNIALITPNLNTLVCCGPLFTSAPTNLSGSCCLNQFPMQGEFFTTLNWNPPTGEAVAGYNVHRNGDLIATLPSTQLTFSDHNRPSDAEDTYDVSSVDNNGIVSFPAEIIVNCT